MTKTRTTSLRIDTEVIKWAKWRAAREPMSLGQLIEIALREYAQNHPKNEKADKQTEQSKTQ